jgi:glycerate kinase
LLGVGGSATNDLGLGALSALGYAFGTAEGRPLAPPIPASWAQLARITGGVTRPIPPIRIACDVANPLLGPRGATAVFGPQKGLRPADFERLEAECARVAMLLCQHTGQSPELMAFPGAGAAGGIAFGLMAGTGARLLPGSSLVSTWLDLERRLAAADLVITGEGVSTPAPGKAKDRAPSPFAPARSAKACTFSRAKSTERWRSPTPAPLSIPLPLPACPCSKPCARPRPTWLQRCKRPLLPEIAR